MWTSLTSNLVLIKWIIVKIQFGKLLIEQAQVNFQFICFFMIHWLHVFKLALFSIEIIVYEGLKFQNKLHTWLKRKFIETVVTEKCFQSKL